MILSLSIVAFVFSIVAILFAAQAMIEIKSMQGSTHKITFYDPKTLANTVIDDPTSVEKSDNSPYDNI